ncbi:hypothetical protein [Chamaesiphon polymorphus]|uniref:Uncharacterized protein n=1 Tax=Chamaesiphon polymorphus CCALA 037 TaxID=2107692 RepID=A0A2T1GL27_9CYAN|nr:hypothetical protein [Chamaesiphon polymorphus]PSB58553.1 hypothetical protein C7B77_04320 [Chamaesiphon polymorphus CCALA 037]
MNIKHLTPILVGMMLSGGIITSAVAQPATPSSQNAQVEHLTCVRDPQGLMCNVDESSSVKSTERVTIHKNSSTPAVVTTEQLAQASDLLLGIIYLGLPSALILAIVRYDRRAAKHTQLVAQLERIWENPHA